MKYQRRNNSEIGILNEIPDEDYENNIIEICKNSNRIKPEDMEGCHHLLLGRNSNTDNKRVIIKFVYRKRSKLMLLSKKSISSKSIH